MSQDNPIQKKTSMKVITLAVLCVLLAASLVAVIAIYATNGNPSDLKGQITEKNNLISSLQANNTALQNQLSQVPDTSVYTNQIATLNQQLANANSQVAGYYNIALMNSSSSLIYQQPLTQDPNATTSIFSDSIFYSGYVIVQATATANTTYAEVIYSYGGFNFDYNQTLGTSGTAAFPVLPGTLIINIGNINQTVANTVTVSATYYY